MFEDANSMTLGCTNFQIPCALSLKKEISVKWYWRKQLKIGVLILTLNLVCVKLEKRNEGKVVLTKTIALYKMLLILICYVSQFGHILKNKLTWPKWLPATLRHSERCSALTFCKLWAKLIEASSVFTFLPFSWSGFCCETWESCSKLNFCLLESLL